MNDFQPSFVAQATHPSFGEQVVDGRITTDHYHFHFQADGIDLLIPLGTIEISPSEDRSGAVFFSSPEQPDWSIYTFDNRILHDVYLTRNANTRIQLKSLQSRGELQRRIKITMWVLGGFAAIAIAITTFTSLAIRVLVSKIPPRFEQEIGAQFIADLKQEETFSDDTNLLARVDMASAPLLKVIPTNQLQLQFFVIEDPDPNAFSIPGGYIVFTTGLLQMCEQPAELTGVMAHEVAHLTEKHMFRQVISSFGPVLLLELLMSGNSSRMNVVGAASSLLIVRGFSQEYEFEADDVGWKYMVAARVNPHRMIDMLTKIKKYEDNQKLFDFVPGAFKTHPATAKRIRKLESKWKRLKNKSEFVG